MCEMIRADVPGLYIFHRAEEVGGLGSRHIASETPDLLAGIKCAIALDRKGFTNIITHQFSRCCSDAFALSLADQLNQGFAGDGWAADDTGVFTDTANYTDLVDECTNLSVGYFQAHTSNECLNYMFLGDLLDTLVHLDQSRLVIERSPGATDTHQVGYWGGHFDAWDNAPDLLRLCREHPDAASSMLEEFGVNANDFQNYIYTGR